MPWSTHRQSFHCDFREFRHFRSRKSLRLYDLFQCRLEHLVTHDKYVKSERKAAIGGALTCTDAMEGFWRVEVHSERKLRMKEGGKSWVMGSAPAPATLFVLICPANFALRSPRRAWYSHATDGIRNKRDGYTRHSPMVADGILNTSYE